MSKLTLQSLANMSRFELIQTIRELSENVSTLQQHSFMDSNSGRLLTAAWITLDQASNVLAANCTPENEHTLPNMEG